MAKVKNVGKVVESTGVEGIKSPLVRPEVRTRAELDNNRLVPCMSIVEGILVYEDSRTKEKTIFADKGDVQDFTLADLKQMNASSQRYLREPWMIILDEEVVDYLKLTELYKRLLQPEDLEKFFKLSEKKIEEYLAKAPKGMKQMIAIAAKKLIDEGNITVAKIRVIEGALNTKLNPLAE